MIIAMNHDDKEGGLIGVMIRVEGCLMWDLEGEGRDTWVLISVERGGTVAAEHNQCGGWRERIISD